jgi:hypothetical protein
MKMMRRIALALTVAIVASIALLAARPALAHEDRTVGPYNLHIGWNVEPALIGQLNAVQLTVTQDSKPVADVEKTLTVTVSTRGQTSDKMNFTASDETPGLYTAAIIPTATGDYQFHLVGTIGTTKVDETFDSAQGKFAAVEPVNDLEFPVKPPTNADLQKEIDDLKAQIASLKGGAPAAATMAATKSK